MSLIIITFIINFFAGLALGCVISSMTVYFYRKQFNLNRERFRMEILSLLYNLTSTLEEDTKKTIYQFLIEQDYYFPENRKMKH